MNILGMGPAEFVLLVILALIIAGPKRMIQWMYVLGRWVARAKMIWLEAVDAIQREIDDAGIDVKVPRELPTRENISRMARDAIKPLSDEVESTVGEVRKVGTELKTAQNQLNNEARITWDAVGNRLASKDNSAPPKTPSTPPAPAAAPPPAQTDVNFGTWGASASSKEDAPSQQ